MGSGECGLSVGGPVRCAPRLWLTRPSLGAASLAGQAAGPVSALHGIQRRDGKKIGSEGGEGVQGAPGRSPTRSQHTQSVRLDFGRLLASGKGTVDPSGAGLRGPGSGFRSVVLCASISPCTSISLSPVSVHPDLRTGALRPGSEVRVVV